MSHHPTLLNGKCRSFETVNSFNCKKIIQQISFDASMMVTHYYCWHLCCSYLRCCEREREFGSVVPFKCKLLNVPERRNEITNGLGISVKHGNGFNKVIWYLNSDLDPVELDSMGLPVLHLQPANGHGVLPNCWHAPPTECSLIAIDVNRTTTMQLQSET